MSDLYARWQQLCKEYEAAQNAYALAFAHVHQKFSQIFQGTSQINPSDGELSKMESACEEWQDVIRRMDEFVKAHV
jgi:hypothetical protein